MNTTYGVKDSQLSGKAEPIIIIKNKLKKGTFGDVNEELSRDLSVPIPSTEIKQHIAYIKSIIPSAIACGSYRREKLLSSDMDVIVLEPIKIVFEKLSKNNYIRGIFNKGAKRMICVVKINDKPYRQLDIIYATKEELPFAKLYFTGPKKFNIKMRILAKKMGLKLNQYGLYKGAKKIPNLKTEKDIFKALKKEYLEPKHR